MTVRERWQLGATLVVAVAVPLAARATVRARTATVAQHLSAAGGVPARIGGIDADLTGSIRITQFGLGSLVEVDAIEAAVAMGSLIEGDLRADEIRVTAPRLALTVNAAGDSDLVELARRIAKHGTRGHAASRVRRIVVDGGALAVHIAGVGELTAEDLVIVPDAGGVRVVTGRVKLHASTGGRSSSAPPTPPAVLDLEFARGAAELALPQLTVGRTLVVGGAGTLAIGGDYVRLLDLGAGRLEQAHALTLRGAIDDDSVPRAFTLQVDRAPGALGLALEADRLPLHVIRSLAPRGIDLGKATATGHFSLRITDSPTGPSLGATGLGTFTGVAIDDPAVAATPVVIDPWIDASVAIARDSITIRQAYLGVGELHLGVHGWVRRAAPFAAQLDASLDSRSCQSLFLSIPAPLRGPLDGLALEGVVAGTARVAIDLAAPDGQGVTLSGSLLGGCTVAVEPPGADVAVLAQVGDQQLADGTKRRMGPAEDWYTSLGNLPDSISGAFVSAEDGRFYEHHGFDLEQIARSFEIDLRTRKLARGGSTISQQLVKNAFLSQRRTLDRKLQEAVLTWRLEARLSKRQILERYLNIIELGPHLFGIHDAARYWFERRPSELSVRQAAFLAALTSQPTSMSRRVRKAGGLDAETADRVGIVLRAMRRDGVIGAEAYSEAKDAPLGFASAALTE